MASYALIAAASLLVSIEAYSLSSGSSGSRDHRIVEEPRLYPPSPGTRNLELESKSPSTVVDDDDDDRIQVHDDDGIQDPKTQKQIEALDQRYNEALVNNHFQRAMEIRELKEETRFEALTNKQKLAHIEKLKKQREKAKKDGDLEKAQEINMEIRHYRPEDTESERAWQKFELREQRTYYQISVALFEIPPIYKMLVGALLLAPALQPMALWQMKGNPPHPFLLARDAVHDPRMWIKTHKWQADILGIFALFGMDIALFGLLQQVGWESGVSTIRAFVMFWYGLVGLATGLYTISRGQQSTVAKSTSMTGGIDLVEYDEFHDNEISVKTVYQDPRIGPFLLFITFFVQCSLLAFYWRYVGVGSGDLTVRECRYWILAIPLQVVARDMLGQDWHYEIPVWRKLLASTYVLRKQDDTGKMKKMEVKRAHTLLRAALSYMANNVIVGSIILTLPLFLMKADSGIDFVKDCFAVVFISTLDDLACDVTLQFETPDAESPS